MNKIKFIVRLWLGVAFLLAACQSSSANKWPTTRPGSIPENFAGRYTYNGSYIVIMDIFADGVYYFNDNTVDYSASGIAEISGNVVTFYESVGPCANQAGSYWITSKPGGFLLDWKEDPCTNRVHIITKQTYIKLAEQFPYVQYIWKTLTKETNYIAVDSQNNIYVTDRGKGYHKFAGDGKILQSVNELSQSAGIAVDSKGNIYAANSSDRNIVKFDSQGKVLFQWTLDSIEAEPAGVAIDGQDNVYVALHRSRNNYVEKFDSDGNFLDSWASQGTQDGQVSGSETGGPEGIAVDQDGNNYLSDPGNNRIIKFDSKGNFLFSLGGSDKEKFTEPRFVSIDKSGNVYVLDMSQSIWKFDSAGKYLGKWFTPSWGAIALDSQGNLLIADYLQVVKVKIP